MKSKISEETFTETVDVISNNLPFRSLAKMVRIFAFCRNFVSICFAKKNNEKISRKNNAEISQKKTEIMQKNTRKFREKYGPFKSFFLVIGWLMTSWIWVNVRGRTETQKDS